MRKLGLAMAMVIAAGTSALADGTRGSMKDVPIAIPLWTGTYVGVQAGALWTDWDFGNATSTPGVGPFAGAGFPLGGFDNTAFTGGLHVAYNRQTGSFVAGIEVDVNWTNAEESRNFVAVGVPPGLPFNLKTSIDSYGTVRGRAGYAMGPMLLYATGGFAWASSEATINSPGQFAGPFNTSDRNYHIGWTAGAGVDYMLSSQWIVSVEYKHIDLGDETYRFTFPFAGGTPVTAKADIVMDEVTLRVSRKF